MATASRVVAGVAMITKIPLPTLISIQRRFVEEGLFPASRGPNVPELSTKHVALYLLGILTDTKAKDCAATARAYYSLKNEDGVKLGDFIVNVLESFKDAPNSTLAQIAYKSRIEVDCTIPRANFSSNCTDGHAETLFGILTEQWNDVSIRRSMTISGRSLFYIGCGLHLNDWSGEQYAA